MTPDQRGVLIQSIQEFYSRYLAGVQGNGLRISGHSIDSINQRIDLDLPAT